MVEEVWVSQIPSPLYLSFFHSALGYTSPPLPGVCLIGNGRGLLSLLSIYTQGYERIRGDYQRTNGNYKRRKETEGGQKVSTLDQETTGDGRRLKEARRRL